eukprot:gene1116-4344_t
MAGSDVWSRLRNLDAYPKTLEDFRVKTFSGAVISIISILVIAVLFTSELILSTEVEPELFVDTSRNEKLRINLDIEFPKMSCEILHLDVMDVSGENELDVDHDIFKQRLSESGEPIYDDPQEVEQLGDQTLGLADKLKSDLNPHRCETCYGAETSDMKCCNTCEDVREAYRRKGWALTSFEGIVQCDREGWAEKLKAQSKEGCRIFGHLEVNKVAGNFHIAPGKSFQQSSIHFHNLNSFGRDAVGKFNLSHTIHHLSFGTDYPDRVNPLDKYTEIITEAGTAMFQYFVKVVPTRYRTANGVEINSNQYSVTMHKRQLSSNAGEAGLPGLSIVFRCISHLYTIDTRHMKLLPMCEYAQLLLCDTNEPNKDVLV